MEKSVVKKASGRGKLFKSKVKKGVSDGENGRDDSAYSY